MLKFNKKNTLIVLGLASFWACSDDKPSQEGRTKTVIVEKEKVVEVPKAVPTPAPAKPPATNTGDANMNDKEDNLDPLDGTKKKVLLTREIYVKETETNGHKTYDYVEDTTRTERGFLRVFINQVNGTIPLKKCFYPGSSNPDFSQLPQLYVSPDKCPHSGNPDALTQDKGTLGYVYKDNTNGNILKYCAKTIFHGNGVLSSLRSLFDHQNQQCPSSYTTNHFFYGYEKSSFPKDPVYAEDK